jgi:hypothetical protein
MKLLLGHSREHFRRTDYTECNCWRTSDSPLLAACLTIPRWSCPTNILSQTVHINQSRHNSKLRSFEYLKEQNLEISKYLLIHICLHSEKFRWPCQLSFDLAAQTGPKQYVSAFLSIYPDRQSFLTFRYKLACLTSRLAWFWYNLRPLSEHEQVYSIIAKAQLEAS